MTKINSIKDSQGTIHKLDEGIGFPSDKYVDLNAQELLNDISNYRYIAPANGFLYANFFLIGNEYADFSTIVYSESGNVLYTEFKHGSWKGIPLTFLLPVQKGFYFRFTAYAPEKINPEYFRFIYAQGSEPEE